MITITQRYETDPEDGSDRPVTADDQLSLPFAKRQISRQRIVLGSGRKAALKIPRGSILRGNDLLLTDQGEIILVVAADESVSIVTADSFRDLSRAAYHLGNRHVAVEIGDRCLSYLHDPVLDEMVMGLGGIQLEHAEKAFEPEAGAYHSHGTDKQSLHEYSSEEHKQ